MLQEELQNLGLSDKEVRVYLAALELGRGTVQEISRKSGVNRATTYIQVEELAKRGLISLIDHEKKSLVQAEKPQRIIEILEKQKGEIQFLQDRFHQLLPDLQAIYNVETDKPRVSYYENEAGLEIIRREILKSRPDLYVFFPKLKDENISFINNKWEKLNSVKIIYAGKENVELSIKPGKNIMIKHFSLADFNIELSMYDNRVFINKPIEHDVSMGVLIEDKVFFKSFMALFNLFWQMGQDINYKI